MTKKTYWLVDAENNYAAAEGADIRDALLPLGWAEAGREPRNAEFVWCRHPEVADPARFPAESLPVWQVRGWEPSYPATAGGVPILVGQDPEVVAVELPPVLAEQPAADTAAEPAAKPKKPTPAAGGTSSTKES